MANAANAGPGIGVNLAEINSSGDPGYSRVPLGTISWGTDGHKYIYVQASAGIAATDPTACVLTEPAMTVAAGAGTVNNPTGTAITSGQRFWAQVVAV